ncbi:transcription regulator, LuxR family, putative [Roseobacter sp. GAI101]|nr:transcription regulator, LuxR family, putative [Roseobacter sp. GAI101]
MSFDMNFQAFTKLSRQADSPGAIWAIVQRYARAHEIRMIAYGSVEVQTYGETTFPGIQFGMPTAFKESYIKEQLYLDNPLPRLAMSRPDPFYWSDAQDLDDLQPAEIAYLDKLKEAGIWPGIAFQVFGPESRNAAVGMCFEPGAPRLSPDALLELQLASQCAHQRFCALTDGPKSPYARLSPRELEVLRWIAQGKSNSVMADIMGISRHTVDTITRRMFEKLEVTDRTRAAVRGISAGLLKQSVDDLM